MIDRLAPPPSAKRVAVRVTPAAERSLKPGHPWLFDQAITNPEALADSSAGDVAVVFDRKRRFLAIGLVDPHSSIRVRLLHHGPPTTIDETWFRERVQAAVERRAALPATDTTGYRLIFGEGDHFSGLIVDRYSQTLVVKLYSAVWFPYLHIIINELIALIDAERVVLRLSRTLQSDAERSWGWVDGQILWGDPPPGPIVFRENGLFFAADVIRGHKTGTFFDHRDNRQWVRKVAQGRSTLDVYAYTGGFSVYAAAGGASDITAIDISRPALELAAENIARNVAEGVADAVPFTPLIGDAFKLLGELAAAGRRFDLVIADPPTFAKRRDEVDGALAAYRRLTALLLDVASPGGILVVASCSSRVPAELFFETVLRAAEQVERPLWIHRKSGHALDHPVLDSFPEGEYLNCLMASPIDP